jgi:hypothetical protein
MPEDPSVRAHGGLRRLGPRERQAAQVQKFVQLYARKAQSGVEPNDRRYDRKVQRRVRRMRP